MPYVYSTITNDTIYCQYRKSATGNLPTIEKKVLIKGGTGVATKQLITPWGIRTEISNEDAEFLSKNEAFLRHKNRGYVRLRDDKVDAEVVAADMQVGDGSAPKQPGDFKETDKAKLADDGAQYIINKISDRFKR